jgi:hypothetical protein
MMNVGERPYAVVASALRALYIVPSSPQISVLALSLMLMARTSSGFIRTIFEASEKMIAARSRDIADE